MPPNWCGCLENQPSNANSGNYCITGTYYAPLTNTTNQYISITFNYVYARNNDGTADPQEIDYVQIAFSWYYNYFKNHGGWGSITQTVPPPGSNIISNNYYNITLEYKTNSTACPFSKISNNNCANNDNNNSTICTQYSSPSSISAAQLNANYNMVTLSNANYPCKRYFENRVSNQLYPGNYLLMK